MTLATAPLEHLGFEETHPNTWRKGVTCDACAAHVETKRSANGGGPKVNFNVARLKADNAGGYTQLGLAKDTYDAARETGNDITAVR